MDLVDATEAFLEQRKRKGLVAGSLTQYRRWLVLWQRWLRDHDRSLELAAIVPCDLVDFLDHLEHEHHAHSDNPRRATRTTPGLAIQSRQSCWRTLRTFWNFLIDEEWLTREQARFFKRGFVLRPRNDDPDGIAQDRAIDFDSVQALLAACGAPIEERTARNQAIVWLLHESGLRVSELCRLDHAHIDQVQMSGRVKGKGGKWGHFFWGERTAAALTRYLALRRGPADGPLFRSCGSRSAGKVLTQDAVRQMIKALAEEAGVQLPTGAPIHGFRTGFAQEMLDAGVDSLDLKQLMRHERLDSTLIYVSRHPSKLRKVYQRATQARQRKPKD